MFTMLKGLFTKPEEVIDLEPVKKAQMNRLLDEITRRTRQHHRKIKILKPIMASNYPENITNAIKQYRADVEEFDSAGGIIDLTTKTMQSLDRI